MLPMEYAILCIVLLQGERIVKKIATIHTDFKEKFGIPRQSGLVEELEAVICFEPPYRNLDAIRGIEEFSHLWLVWEFSQCIHKAWTPTVRPPRLGGNERRGVFATRSPFRPNPIGLSCVKLTGVEQSGKEGPVLHVSGADLLDGTPIYDIKPYLPYVDSHPDAIGGFAAAFENYQLQVHCDPDLLIQIPEEKRTALLNVLAQDPRPAYQTDPTRRYGMYFAGFEVTFHVKEQMLWVDGIKDANSAGGQEIFQKEWDDVNEITYTTGEQHDLWGIPYGLVVERSLKKPLTEIREGQIYMRVSAKSTVVERQKQLDAFYKKEMADKLQDIKNKYEPIVGKKAEEWRFRRMKSRWGSCQIQKRRICLNVELAEKPPECLAYVVVHELTHLHEPAHNKRFWSLVEQFYDGDVKYAKELLR